MLRWLFMVPIYYGLIAILLWGGFDLAEHKWYRGRAGFRRLLLHSLILGSILAVFAPYIDKW